MSTHESTIRHLTYHVWPVRRASAWRWNIAQLARRIDLFNGKRILGVAVDETTDTAESVRRYAEQQGIVFTDVIEQPNHKHLREVATWIPMLDLLNPASAGVDEVVFSAHAKGIRHQRNERDPSAPRDWADVMYRACLDDWPAIETILQTKLAAGAFRLHNEPVSLAATDWMFAGTFFWWRLAEISKRAWRDVERKYYGTETWIGRMCTLEETECLFFEDCPDLYSERIWKHIIWPAWHALHPPANVQDSGATIT